MEETRLWRFFPAKFSSKIWPELEFFLAKRAKRSSSSRKPAHSAASRFTSIPDERHTGVFLSGKIFFENLAGTGIEPATQGFSVLSIGFHPFPSTALSQLK
jgi:hypothetical protein